jgi:predicted dehydrogenase
MAKQINYGMVGGHNKAFIGDVHRKALNFDPRAKLVAGCFSTRESLNRETGETYGLAEERVYPDYRTMAAAEAARPDGIDFVVIVTPNVTHYEIAKCFLESGINVFCEKPLCFTVEQAEDLKKTSEEKSLLFGVAHGYTGYTMSKVMKEMISNGKIGEIVAVNAEYAQDWLLDELDPDSSGDMNLAVWRTDPKLSGIANCIGDIGTHIENYVAYITGLKIRKVLATRDKFCKALELNANMILEYDNGAHGAYWCSQIAAGHCNGLSVRVYGDKGSLEWVQENPEVIRYTPKNEAPRLINRGTPAVSEKAGSFGRIPSGHPEGLYVAFANLYREYINAVEAKKAGKPCNGYDYPSVSMGLDGVKFVHAAVESADNGSRWVEIN